MLTAQALKHIAPSLTIDKASHIASICEKILPVYGLWDKDVLPEFIAQVCHESGEFSVKAENMNYSARRMLIVWPSRFASLKVALKYEFKPRELANFVYNGRMGNILNSNDGWNFRGSGFIQLTGRANIEEYLKFKTALKGYRFQMQPLTPELQAEALRSLDDWAMDGAGWFFAVKAGLIPKAKANDFIGITRAINGGLVGLEDRQKYYARAKEVIK